MLKYTGVLIFLIENKERLEKKKKGYSINEYLDNVQMMMGGRKNDTLKRMAEGRRL